MILRTRRNPRRGTVLVLAAIAITVLIMVVGITLDGGLLLADRRQVQAAADAAAMAGAADLFKNYSKNSGVDSAGTAAASAVAIAKANGYENDGSAAPAATIETRVFGQNYLGGPKAGLPVERAYIEVTITYNQPRFFSALMGSGPLPVAARAVATGSWGIPRFGMLILAPTGVGLKLGGQGTVDVTTGIIAVNSTDAGAVTNQSNATLMASQIDITGGLTGAGTIITSPIANNVHYGVPPSPDPLTTLPAPSASSLTTVSNVAAVKPADIKDTSILSVITNLAAKGVTVKNVYILEAGIYGTTAKNKLPNFTNGDLVVMQQASYNSNKGIYYLSSGGFNSNGASIVMSSSNSGGVMFFNAGTGTNDKISITGNPDGIVSLSGMAGGIYQGLIVFQSRSATEAISITGNGEFDMLGTFYAPNATLNFTGNGASQTLGSALIAKNVTLSGNGQINIAFSSGKIAPQRMLRLAE